MNNKLLKKCQITRQHTEIVVNYIEAHQLKYHTHLEAGRTTHPMISLNIRTIELAEIA